MTRHRIPFLNALPDAETLLALEPEELGARLLFIFKQDGNGRERFFDPYRAEVELWSGPHEPVPGYPRNVQADVSLAMREAVAWLEAQGLIVPAEGPNGLNGFRVLSRRARSFEDRTALDASVAARRLNRDLLHSRIAQSVWAAFMRGEYAQAVFTAMREVEIAVREAAGFPLGDHGVPMARRAFHKDSGPLRDPSQEEPEREALMHLFAGGLSGIPCMGGHNG